jgi:AMMECR1 domain-containing protein
LYRSVSLLTNFEDVDDPFDWELGTHGIHIHFEDPAYAVPVPTDSPASMSSTDSNATSSDSGGLKNKLSTYTGVAKRKALTSRGARTMSATYLPDVAPSQGWNKEETLDSAIRKAGFR